LAFADKSGRVSCRKRRQLERARQDIQCPIRAGAYDFVTKPFDIEALHLTIERAFAHRSLREEVKRLRRAVEEGWRFDELIGASPAMRRVYDLIDLKTAVLNMIGWPRHG
jgi:DNA-binding NtrC family response regulator